LALIVLLVLFSAVRTFRLLRQHRKACENAHVRMLHVYIHTLCIMCVQC
jgi:hypothetical protein